MDIRRTVAPAVALAALSLAVAAGFTRLLKGDEWLALVLMAAVAPHAIGVATRRTRAWAQVSAWVLGLIAYVVWAVVPATTRTGLPTLDTFHELGRRIDTGLGALRDHGAPIPATAGVVLLVVLCVWVMSCAADVLAFRRSATIGALTPAVTVFIWIAALAPDAAHAAIAAAAVAVAGAAFVTLWHPILHAKPRGAIGEPRRGASIQRLAGGIALALAATGVAAIVAPSLPGAAADPLFDLRRDGVGSSAYQTSVPPLVDVVDSLQRTDRTELFTVASPEPQYWRTVALDEYSEGGGGQWTLRASGDDIERGLTSRSGDRTLLQQFEIGAMTERWMPAAFAPVAVSRDDTLVVSGSLTLVTDRDSVSGMRYRVRSQPPATELTQAQKQATAAPPPSAFERFTELPSSLPSEVAARARAITAGATTAYERAERLRDFFRDGNGFVYDPNVDLTDSSNATVTFLDTKRGFCVQFASTYALMARAVGIPSRVAVGFTPGTVDPATGRYVVSNFEAHAWPEVWLAGIGWTNRFEPTPPSAAPGGSDLPGDDAVTAATPPTTIAGPPQTSAESTPVPGTAASGSATPTPTAVEPGTNGRPPAWVWIAALVAVLTAGVVAAIPLAKSRRRAARRRRPDPASRVAGAWEEALDRLLEIGEPRSASTTPSELTERVAPRIGLRAADALGDLAEVHTAAQFGPGPVGVAIADRARDNFGEFDRALRDELPLRQRLRALLGPPLPFWRQRGTDVRR